MPREAFTILLIEDDRDDERLALRALLGCGIPLVVQVARDGVEALEALGLEGTEGGRERRVPDLVISDLKMPKLNGDEVLRRARADVRLAPIPYVLFSSSDEPGCIEGCLALGASEYATKPIDFEAYIARVRGFARRWLGSEGEPIEGDRTAKTQAR